MYLCEASSRQFEYDVEIKNCIIYWCNISNRLLFSNIFTTCRIAQCIKKYAVPVE